MSANTVIRKIEEKANAACAEILKNGEARAAEMRQTILAAAEARAEDIEKSAKAQADLLLRAAAQQAALDNKIDILNHKHKLLSEVREAAKHALSALPDETRMAFLEKYIRENIGEGTVTLQFSEQDAKLFVAYKKDLGKNVKIGNIETEIDGGVLVCTESYDVDLSYDALLDSVFEQHEKEIADCLFAKKED